MEKEIKSRIWKYFLEQKAYEVLKVVGYLLVGYILIVGLPIAVGLNLGDGYSRMCGIGYQMGAVECDLFETWVEGAFYLIIISLISWGIFRWFESNWWEADWRVRGEIEEQKRKRRK